MKGIKLLIVTALLHFCLINAGVAQNNETPKQPKTFADHLVIGGNFGAQFGTVTMIDLSPTIGYKITDRFVAGIGITYQYYRTKNQYYNYVFKTSIYGGSVFARYYILENLFAHVEYEALSLETKYFDYGYPPVHKGTRFMIGSPMAGLGYRQAVGENSSFNIMVLWNFNETIYTPYSNPIIKVGLSFGK